MSEVIRIPEPPDSNVTLVQGPEGDATLPAPARTSFDVPPLLSELRGVVTVNPKVLGGPLGQAITLGSVAQFAEESRETRSELSLCRRQLDEERRSHRACETKHAVLAERLAATLRNQTLTKFAIFSGTILLGIAADNRDDMLLAGVLAVLGIVLLGIGWFGERVGTLK